PRSIRFRVCSSKAAHRAGGLRRMRRRLPPPFESGPSRTGRSNRPNPWRWRFFQAAGVPVRVTPGTEKAKTKPIPPPGRASILTVPPEPPKKQNYHILKEFGDYFSSRDRDFFARRRRKSMRESASGFLSRSK